MDEILKEYHDLQTNYRGILWPLLYRGKLYMIRIRPYVFACLGDTPGQNYMCGKMGSPNCNRICRYCDIEKKHLSHPWIPSKLMSKQRVQEIQSDTALSKAFSYKEVNICWDKLNFGVPTEDINTNVPGDVTTEEGFYIIHHIIL